MSHFVSPVKAKNKLEISDLIRLQQPDMTTDGTHDSLPYRMVGITSARYTTIFVCYVRFLLPNTRSLRWPKADEPMLGVIGSHLAGS